MSAPRWIPRPHDQERPVALQLPGIDSTHHYLTADEVFAIARRMPKVAGPWRRDILTDEWFRVGADGFVIAVARQRSWETRRTGKNGGDQGGTAADVDAAKRAADAALVAAGYLLAGGSDA